jgi:hypothetical protein
MLAVGGNKLWEGGQQALNSRPGHLAELAGEHWTPAFCNNGGSKDDLRRWNPIRFVFTLKYNRNIPWFYVDALSAELRFEIRKSSVLHT